MTYWLATREQTHCQIIVWLIERVGYTDTIMNLLKIIKTNLSFYHSPTSSSLQSVGPFSGDGPTDIVAHRPSNAFQISFDHMAPDQRLQVQAHGWNDQTILSVTTHQTTEMCLASLRTGSILRSTSLISGLPDPLSAPGTAFALHGS
jgi:hypothetical protein